MTPPNAAVPPPPPEQRLIEIARIRAEGNLRETGDDAEMDELVASIRERGYLHPVIACAIDHPDFDYDLIAGYRRVHAGLRAGLTHVPARIFPEPADAAERYAITLTENLQTKPMTAWEINRGIETLLGLGLQQDEIGRRLGWSDASISRYRSLSNLTDPVRARWSAGAFSFAHARELARLPADRQEAFAARAARLTSDALAKAIGAHLRGTPGDVAAPKARKHGGGLIRLPSYEARLGTKVLTLRFTDQRSRRARTPGDYLGALEQLIERLRGLQRDEGDALLDDTGEVA